MFIVPSPSPGAEEVLGKLSSDTLTSGLDTILYSSNLGEVTSTFGPGVSLTITSLGGYRIFNRKSSKAFALV